MKSHIENTYTVPLSFLYFLAIHDPLDDVDVDMEEMMRTELKSGNRNKSAKKR